jgi:hypothetical protein
MKVYLTYGLVAAVANAVLTSALYLLGFHDEAKVKFSQLIEMPIMLAIGILVLVLGIKARRSELWPAQDFSYGRALGAGVMISLMAALFGLVTSGVYFGVIHPEFSEMLTRVEVARMEAQGRPPATIEAAEKMMKFIMNPAMLTIMGFLYVFINGTILSLIIAAFLKRRASDQPPTLS